MAVKLNNRAFDYAKHLVQSGKCAHDDMDDWSEHQPTAKQENQFIEEHGFEGYGHWYLGVDNTKAKNTKEHYKFPYGDFRKIHRCGVIAAEVRAGQYKHLEIEEAAAHLHGMLDASK